jgi:hypothetical protein
MAIFHIFLLLLIHYLIQVTGGIEIVVYTSFSTIQLLPKQHQIVVLLLNTTFRRPCVKYTLRLVPCAGISDKSAGYVECYTWASQTPRHDWFYSDIPP